MKIKKYTVITGIVISLLCNCAFADDSTTSLSQANDMTVALRSIDTGSAISILKQLSLSNRQINILNNAANVINSGQIPSGYNSWGDYANAVFDKLSLSRKQMQVLLEVKNSGQLPDGYSSWQEYGEYLVNNPDEIYSLLSSISSSASSMSSMYQKAQSALLTMPTALLAGGYLNQLNSYDEAFHNSDMQMMLPYKTRIAYRYANRYAVVEDTQKLPSKTKSAMLYSDLKHPAADKGLWVRPYVSIGSINFKNGPKVDNNMYGVFLGGDSSIRHLKRADFQYSAYVGYNGSNQSYGDNSVYSNGGMFGLTGSWYGEKAFASVTVNAGASNAELNTFYTKKDYPMFSTGIAAKTGYNFEFADGKFIIQPSYLMSYSFVTPFEKGSIAGMKIDSKPLNAINISPGIKFIGNLKYGWQPYAEARMVWNLLDKTDYSTTYIDVPSISIKPYAQYGVGIQKLWGKCAIGFLQFTMRSGGRNDVAFSGGLKFKIGKEKL